jgi:hypothetical protein
MGDMHFIARLSLSPPRTIPIMFYWCRDCESLNWIIWFFWGLVGGVARAHFLFFWVGSCGDWLNFNGACWVPWKFSRVPEYPEIQTKFSGQSDTPQIPQSKKPISIINLLFIQIQKNSFLFIRLSLQFFRLVGICFLKNWDRFTRQSK